jgi:hypothetical protein
MKKKRKISDTEFLTILRENAGLFSKTAKAIQNQFGIEYTRQAVRDRAQRFTDELEDITEETLDLAEEGLHSIIANSEDRVRLKAIEFFLKMKGKRRGYSTIEIPVPVLSEYDKKLSRMTDEELNEEIKRLEAENEKHR